MSYGWLAVRLQLVLRARRPVHEPQVFADGQCGLVVLFQQVHRVPRHLLLCGQEKVYSGLNVARVAPRSHAVFCMGCMQICTRRPRVFWRPLQRIRARVDVHLLLPVGLWPQCAALLVVETLLDPPANGAVLARVFSQCTVALHQPVWLPRILFSVCCCPHGFVFCALCAVLHQGVHSKGPRQETVENLLYNILTISVP